MIFTKTTLFPKQVGIFVRVATDKVAERLRGAENDHLIHRPIGSRRGTVKKYGGAQITQKGTFCEEVPKCFGGFQAETAGGGLRVVDFMGVCKE